MSTVMNASEFVIKLKDVADNYKTLYVMGCFGAPMTDKNKTRYCNNHSYNKQVKRTAMIKAASADTFGFDCVNLIKGIVWGWSGDKSKTYGGAKYASNGVKDVSADKMITLCEDVTTDFSYIEVGEALWCKGHIGVYIGDGLAIECTPAWKNKVQYTAVKNIGTKPGYNARKWTKHGKLPFIKYDEKPVETPVKTPAKKKTVKASETAQCKDTSLKGTYKTTGKLHLRDGAGANKKSLCVMPKGISAKNYGFYSMNGSTKWLYIQVTIDNVTYTGFSSSKYLKKQ